MRFRDYPPRLPKTTPSTLSNPDYPEYPEYPRACALNGGPAIASLCVARLSSVSPANGLQRYSLWILPLSGLGF